ncbi:MAG: FimV/HubP family polar landmark protein [Pseudomonadota bacterium]
MFLSTSAYAAGLGKLTVLSALGQPLNAEIELTAVSADEASGLVAKLAPAEAFRVANIEFNPALLSLRFAVEQRGGRQFVKITSSQPVNEPFVDLLLELSWNSGRLVREYTFLLDPADMRTAQPAQVAPSANQINRVSPPPVQQGSNPRPAGQAANPRPAPAQQAQTSQPGQQASAPAREEGASEYRVRAGDTLGKIAGRLKPVEVSLDMMLVALYRANPDAFAGNNMNRLKSGQILTVPDAATIQGNGQGEARGVVVAHAADFNAYRAKLAGQVATAAPDKAPEATQSTGGKITAQVAERPTAANVSKDQLKLSKATAATDVAGKSAAVSMEEKIAKEKALADASARVKELERNVSELEKLMAVKSKAGTEAQKPAVVAAPAAVPAPVPAAAPVVAAPAAVKPDPVVKAPAATTPAASQTATLVPAAEKPVMKTLPTPATPVLAAPEEKSFFDMLMENIVLVAGGLLALLAVLGLLAFSRRKKEDPQNTIEPSILGAPTTDQAHSLFAETGGQSVDTSNSVFNSSFAPSASQLDTNEVDPVAEADVYIAYGRDAQAEEILKEALRTHPERYPVRLKLLEIYAARKDLRAFEAQATELYGMTKGSGDEWTQAALLGLAVDPSNALYASAAAAGPATAIHAAVQEATLKEELKAPVLAQQVDLGKDSGAPAKAAETNTMDFDVAGLSFEPVKAAAPAASMEMDFAPTAAAAAVAPVALEKKDEGMSFDMDFNLPGAEPEPVIHDMSAEFANAGKDDLGDLSSAFNIPSAPAAPAKPADNSMDFGDMSFDLPSTPAPSPAPAAPQFDMSSLNLDLPSATGGSSVPEFAMENVGPGDLSAQHMEMDTKLDLAIAYEEIGDKEGARELLDEVIKGGSSEQVGKANEMRAKLA